MVRLGVTNYKENKNVIIIKIFLLAYYFFQPLRNSLLVILLLGVALVSQVLSFVAVPVIIVNGCRRCYEFLKNCNTSNDNNNNDSNNSTKKEKIIAI